MIPCSAASRWRKAVICAAISATATLCSPVSAQTQRTGGCATLVGATADSSSSQSFTVRNGEAVDLVGAERTIHGRLLVFADGAVFRVYWQADTGHEKYALANAGDNAVRLVSTPPQGEPATNGQPATTSPPLTVLSCPAL